MASPNIPSRTRSSRSNGTFTPPTHRPSPPPATSPMMRLLAPLLLSSSAAATTIYTSPNAHYSVSTSTLSPISARLLLAQRAGVEEYHIADLSRAEVIDTINTYGLATPLFTAQEDQTSRRRAFVLYQELLTGTPLTPPPYLAIQLTQPHRYPHLPPHRQHPLPLSRPLRRRNPLPLPRPRAPDRPLHARRRHHSPRLAQAEPYSRFLGPNNRQRIRGPQDPRGTRGALRPIRRKLGYHRGRHLAPRDRRRAGHVRDVHPAAELRIGLTPQTQHDATGSTL